MNAVGGIKVTAYTISQEGVELHVHVADERLLRHGGAADQKAVRGGQVDVMGWGNVLGDVGRGEGRHYRW